jgi:hypothetical protein
MTSQNYLQLTPITDPKEVHRLEFMLQDIIDYPGHIKVDWLIKNEWVAVPVESASHFNKSDAEAISHALQTINCKYCFAVATEPLANFTRCFQVPTTSKSLLAFSWECSHFNFVLIPEHRSFAILCTVYDYYIVAGSTKFVKQAVGGNIETARAKFNEFASDEFWEGRLLEVAQKYQGI